MDGTTLENTQVPTYVRTLAEDFQLLNATVTQNSQDIGILRQSLQGEVGSLRTNDTSLQTLIESQGASLTQEQLVRAKLVQGVADEVSDLRSQHSKDHATVVGLIEEHHGDTLHEFASQSAALDAERSERIEGDAALGAKLNETAQQSAWYFNASMSAVAEHAQALDDTTWDSTEWSFDNDDYTFGWSILSAAQQWELELGSYIAKAESDINAKLRSLESVVIQSAQDSSQALENTDVSNLVDSLLGRVGIDALDAELWGRFSEVESGIERERRERAEQVSLEASQQSQRLFEESQKLSDRLLAETAERADALAEVAHRTAQLLELETQERVALIEAEAQRLLDAIDALASSSTQALEAKTNELSVAYDKKVTDVRDELRQQYAQLQTGVTASIEELRTADSNTITSLNAFKVSTGEDFAVVRSEISVVTNAHESTATTVEGLSASFNTLNEVAAKTTADVATLTEIVADADSALAERIDTVSAELNKTNAEVNTVSTAVADLDSATASRFETVSTDLDGLGTSVANAQRVADSAVTANSAQASELNSVKATLANKADALAVTNLEAVVNGNEQAMSSRIDSLAASLTDLGEGAETNVDVYAFNALKAEVTNTQGVVTGHTTDLNTLKGAMTNAQSGIEATNEAVSGIETTITQHGKDIANQATEITSLGAGLTKATDTLSTKADTTALNATNTKVTSIDGRTTANTNSLTSLAGRVTATENGLSKKADSSALQDIYTKTESDAKATQIAAGQVSAFKAAFALGGENLIDGSNKFRVGSSGAGLSRTILEDGSLQIVPNALTGAVYLSLWGSLEATASYKTIVPKFSTGEEFTVTVWVKAYDIANVPTEPFTMSIGGGMGYIASTMDLEKLALGKEVRCVHTRKWTLVNTQSVINPYFGFKPTTLGGGLIVTKWQIERGNVGTDWSESDVDLQAYKNAQSEAFTTVNVRVTEVAGEITTQSERIDVLKSSIDDVDDKTNTAIQNAATAQTTANTAVTKTESNASQLTGLASRVATAEGNLSKKADATILDNYYTSAKADEVIAGQLTEFKSTLVLGGTNLVQNSFKNFQVGASGQSAKLIRTILADGSLQLAPTAETFEGTYFTNWWGGTTSFQPAIKGLNANEEFTVTLWFRALDKTKLPTALPSFYLSSNMSYLPLTGDLTALASGNEVGYTQTRKWFPGTTALLPHLNIASDSLGGGLILTKWKLEVGAFSTSWTEATEDVQARTVSVATALADRYTKVDANSAIAVATNSLRAEFDNSLALYDQTIDTWVERNKVEAAMVESLAAELVPHMAGNTELFADIEINAGYQGVVTALADANATTAARVDKFEARFGDAFAAIETTETAVADLEKSMTQQMTVMESTFDVTVDDAVKSAVDDLTGMISQTNAMITNDYVTKADATTAIANATSEVKSEVKTDFAAIVETVRERVVGTIDLSTMDPDLYYPVQFTLPKIRNYIQISCKLGEFSGQVPWSTHNTKSFSMNLEWEVGPSGWGGQAVNRTIADFSFLWSAQSPILEPKQISQTSAEYVYLRGGATYGFRATYGVTVAPHFGDWDTGHGILKPKAYDATALPVTTLNVLSTVVTEQKESIDGVRGISTITIDNNGVMSGYGLVSELVAGQVTSAFGVNADQFYVGSPSTGKKVFSVVGGQTVINDAIVGNLSADKITTGTLHGDRITAGTINADHIAGSSVTADKLNVTSLSALSAILGTFTSTSADGSKSVLTGSKMEVFYPNGRVAVRLGIF